MNNNIKELLPYISYLSAFLNVMKVFKDKGRTIIENSRVREYDIGDVFNDIINGKRNIGDYISTEGFLLNYGQVFKPTTFINSVWSPTPKDEVEEFNKIHKGTIHELRENEILFERKNMYLPIQKINTFNNIGCAFIFDSRFKGFIKSKSDSSINNDLKVDIDKYSKPILVLYDINKHTRFINKKVALKGKISIVPDKVIKDLNLVHNDSIKEICSNFYRPYIEGESMICISLLDDKSKVELCSQWQLEKSFSELEIPIFIEAKLNNFKGIDKNMIIKYINSMMPNSYDKYLGVNIIDPFTLRCQDDDGFTFPSTNNIQLVYTDPGNIGFYTTTSLIDNEKFPKDLDEFTRYINNFSIDYKNLSKKEFGNKDKMEVTFLFDSKKRNLLNHKNINFMVDRPITNDKELLEKLRWIGMCC